MNNMAKLNVVIPAVEIMVDGVAYRKVDRKAQAGDIIRFDGKTDEDEITSGGFYAVNRIDSFGDARITDDYGDDDYDTAGEDFDVYAPVSESAPETITIEGATWRKVDRDVREGDAIKFTDEDRSSYLTEAELYVVNHVDSCDDPQITDDDGVDYDAGSDDYEVYEKVAEEKAEPVRLAVGDYARVVSTSRTFVPEAVVAGNLVKIAQDDESHRPFRAELTDGNRAGWFTESELVRATDEEVAAAKRAALIAQFSVGDSVKLTVEDGKRPRYGYGSVSNGDIGKVTRTSGHMIIVDFPSNNSWMADPTELTKLTAAEIAEIERKQAEETKWNAIGRKVNEFKVGDIVKFLGSDRYNALTSGDIGTVVREDSDGDLRVNTQNVSSGNWCAPSQITLIVPVEQRFDRVEEVDAA